MSIARTDNSTLGRWWWTIDRWTLLALVVLSAIGIVLAMAASPTVAERIGLDPLHFLRRQATYLPLALMVMVGGTLFPGLERGVGDRVSSVPSSCFATLCRHRDYGARRWISIVGFSCSPWLVKPALLSSARGCRWLVALERFRETRSRFCHLPRAAPLLLQPDVGQALVVSVVWFCQWFLAGLPMA